MHLKDTDLSKQPEEGMALNASVTCRFPTFVEDSSHNIDIFTAAANSFLSVVTVTGNTFVIFVIWKQGLYHVPYNILLCCLAFSDFVVGLVAQPSLAIYKVMEIGGEPSATSCVARNVQVCSGWLTGGVYVCAQCAVSLDRYLALRLHAALHSSCSGSTSDRSCFLPLAWWCGLRRSPVFHTEEILDDRSKCYFTPCHFSDCDILRKCLVPNSPSPSPADSSANPASGTLSREKRDRGRPTQEISRDDVVRSRGIHPVLLAAPGDSNCRSNARLHTWCKDRAYDFSSIFLFLSSSVNPLLYCWRIREMRQAVINILRRT